MRTPIILTFTVFFSCLFELIVIDEEVLLLLCFVAFFFNAYINFSQQVFDSIDQRAKTIKAEFLNHLETKNKQILANIEQVEASAKKRMMWYLADATLGEILKKIEYSLENLLWSRKIFLDLSQSLLQKFIYSKKHNNDLLLRSVPLSSLKG